MKVVFLRAAHFAAEGDFGLFGDGLAIGPFACGTLVAWMGGGGSVGIGAEGLCSGRWRLGRRWTVAFRLQPRAIVRRSHDQFLGREEIWV